VFSGYIYIYIYMCILFFTATILEYSRIHIIFNLARIRTTSIFQHYNFINRVDNVIRSSHCFIKVIGAISDGSFQKSPFCVTVCHKKDLNVRCGHSDFSLVCTQKIFSRIRTLHSIIAFRKLNSSFSFHFVLTNSL